MKQKILKNNFNNKFVLYTSYLYFIQESDRRRPAAIVLPRRYSKSPILKRERQNPVSRNNNTRRHKSYASTFAITIAGVQIKLCRGKTRSKMR